MYLSTNVLNYKVLDPNPDICHTNVYTQLFPQLFCNISFTIGQHANIGDKKLDVISSFSMFFGPFFKKFENIFFIVKAV